MRIVRQARPERFTVVDNRVIEDARLSFRARGLLIFLLSKPDGWETDSTELARDNPEGRDAIRTALRQLATLGYIEEVKRQDKATGLWRTERVVRDQPRRSKRSR